MEKHLESFINKCKAKGYEYIDWDSAFKEAIRENWGKIANDGNGSKQTVICHNCRKKPAETVFQGLNVCLECEAKYKKLRDGPGPSVLEKPTDRTSTQF